MAAWRFSPACHFLVAILLPVVFDTGPAGGAFIFARLMQITAEEENWINYDQDEVAVKFKVSG